MLDKEAKEKLLTEALKAAKEAEDLFGRHFNDVLDDSGVSAQMNSYKLFRRKVARCRQLKGLLDAGNVEYDKERLEKIIDAFDALAEPKWESVIF